MDNQENYLPSFEYVAPPRERYIPRNVSTLLADFVRPLIDVVWVDHVSNKPYQAEFLSSLGDWFSAVSIPGVDGDLEAVRRAGVQAVTPGRKYCLLADADDVYVPEGIAMAIAYLEDHPEVDAAVAADIRFVGTCPWKVTQKMAQGLITGRDVREDVLLMHNCIIYRTEVIQSWMRQFKTAAGVENFDWHYKAAFADDHKVWAIGYPGVFSRIRTDDNSWLTGRWKHLKG